MDIRQGSLIPDPVKNGFLKAIDPLADGLIRLGLRPNSITTISVMLLIGSGAAYGLQALRVGAVLLLASGCFDVLDGKVARRGRMSSKFGAFYDSTMDRLGEAALLTGIAIYFMNTPGQRLPFLGLGLCFAALSGSFLVSYARARAEGIGIECKVGIAQRAERFLALGIPTAIWGAGRSGWLLLGILFVLSLIAWITVVQRIRHVYRQTVLKGI